jgi:hypothetical protein
MSENEDHISIILTSQYQDHWSSLTQLFSPKYFRDSSIHPPARQNFE